MALGLQMSGFPKVSSLPLYDCTLLSLVRAVVFDGSACCRVAELTGQSTVTVLTCTPSSHCENNSIEAKVENMHLSFWFVFNQTRRNELTADVGH